MKCFRIYIEYQKNSVKINLLYKKEKVKIKRSSVVILFGLLVTFVFNPFSVFANSEEVSIITTEDGKEVGIGKPKVKSIKPNFVEGDEGNNFEVQEVIEDNDLKQSITIDPSSINTTVEIPFEFQNGEYVVLTKDEEGKNNGSGNIYNKDNESIGVISIQVIEEQENLNLDSIIKNDNVLELDIETDNLQPIEIELFASATYYSTYFSSGKWITRSAPYPVSLSLKHKPYLTGGSNAVAANARMNDAWSKVIAVHSGNAKWKNAAGLKKQFQCHFNHAWKKNPWNLEPGRPNVSYAKTVAAGCNPK